MVKRFTIGFLLGLGLMYWYIHESEDLFAQGSNWMQRSSSGYRGDQTHDAARSAQGD
jgi:hypothetical protein